VSGKSERNSDGYSSDEENGGNRGGFGSQLDAPGNLIVYALFVSKIKVQRPEIQLAKNYD
jgi:hypothetical protein